MLFGLLALQNGLIDQEELVAAFRAWSRDKVRPIAEYLVEHGSLDSDDRTLPAVEALVKRHVKKHGGSTEEEPGCGRGRPVDLCESLAQVGDPGVEERRLHTSDPSSDRMASAYADSNATCLQP